MTMSQKSDLLVLEEMATKDLKIRCSVTLVEARTHALGGHLTMGIDEDTIGRMMQSPGDYLTVLYVVDKKEFMAIKNPPAAIDPDRPKNPLMVPNENSFTGYSPAWPA